MAKMKIYEIARSLQEKFPEIKSKDLIALLNENGFEAKSANSSIEDSAIAFLLQKFKDPNNAPIKASSAKKEEKASKSVKATKKAEKPEEAVEKKSVEKVEAESVKSAKTESASAGKEHSGQKNTGKTKSGTVEGNGTTQAKPAQEEEKTNRTFDGTDAGKSGGAGSSVVKDNHSGSAGRDGRNGNNSGSRDSRATVNSGRDSRSAGGSYGRDSRSGSGSFSRDGRNGSGFNRDDRSGGGTGKDGRSGGFSRDNRNGSRDNRGGNNGNYNNRSGRQNGVKVIEKFERSQSGIDAIKPEVKASRQQRSNKNDSRSAKQRYGRDRERDEKEEEFLANGRRRDNKKDNKKKDPNRKGAFIKPEPVAPVQEEEGAIKTIVLPEKLTIKELADKMKQPPAAVVKKLLLQGKVVSINREITFEEAEEIALEYNCIAEPEEKVDVIAEILKEDEEDESLMEKRPPVVCVMGHVDHGKTSLLDAIRKTNVTEKEAGGITQHIGAYMVEANREKITFLDTPGHEAFTSMRMRGAKSTDIAILVVAADDGVMPQTIEAINHAKAAGIEIIVAVNKIDKPSANIERVKQELVEHELISEDWGGSTIFVPVSAHTGEGIEQLLEMILLTSEVCELKANKNRKARGIVIEARLDKGRGPVATILIQKGTLKVGENIAIGAAYGKVRAMMDDKGNHVKLATPSTPVEIIGLHDVPDAGEIFLATESDKEARSISEAYINQGKERLLADTKSRLSLEGLFSQIQAGNIKELNLIIKADVQGSVEAVKQSLLKLSNEEVAVRVIHGGVGAITESDVTLASASNAIIIGFNVRPDNTAKEIAEREQVDLRLYRVIYNAIEDIEAAMKGMQEPEYVEKVIGHAEIRQVFKASGIGNIAGSYVLDGNIVRNCKVRISREGEQIFEGELASLKRFKDDVKEVASGYECGLVFNGFNDIKVEDQVEAYIMEEVPR